MKNFEYIETFDKIFWDVAEELGIANWWELFDSENFDEVEKRIAKAFNETDASEVPSFTDWYNDMAGDL